MLRDVPHCRSILACGIGGLILSVAFLTLVYPLFCNRVTQVKETKVREYMEGRFGIYDRSASTFRLDSDAGRELSKVARPSAGAGGADPGALNADAIADTPDVERDERIDDRGHETALPAAKRR